MQPSKGTVLITGVAGFVAFHLSHDLLEKGYSVWGVDSFNDYYDVRMKEKRIEILSQNKNFSYERLNFADYTNLHTKAKDKKIEMIIHLGAQAGVLYSLVNPWAYEESNIKGTLSIFELARHLNIKKVFYASSASVYGGNTKLPFEESDPTDQPLSLYAVSKKTNELLAKTYHSTFGLRMVGLRFFNLYGTYGRPDMAFFQFSRAILSDSPITLRGGNTMKRNFTHISDCIRAINGIIEKDTYTCDVYNIGGSQVVPVPEAVTLLEKYLGKKAKINNTPKLQGEIEVAYASTKKLTDETGYTPKMTIEQGLQEYATWFLENKDWLLSLKEFK